MPVPREAYQDGDIAWFEAGVSGRDKRIQLVALTFDGLEVGRAEARLTGELDVQTTITGPQSEVRINMSPVANAEATCRYEGASTVKTSRSAPPPADSRRSRQHPRGSSSPPQSRS